jgi:hypothetical protein
MPLVSKENIANGTRWYLHSGTGNTGGIISKRLSCLIPCYSNKTQMLISIAHLRPHSRPTEPELSF